MSLFWGWFALALAAPQPPVSVPVSTIPTTRTVSVTKSLVRVPRQKIIDYALRHSPAYQVALVALRRAKAQGKGAGVFPNNPVLSAGGGAALPIATSTGSAVLPRASASLSLALPVGGRWGRNKRLARAQILWQKSVLQHKRYHLSMAIHRQINTIAYANLILQKRKAIAAYFKEVERVTHLRIKHGSASPVDIPFVQAARLQAAQATLTAALQLRLARQALQTLVGWRSPQKPMPWALTATPGLPALPKSQDLHKRALQGHVRLQVARARATVAKAGLGLSKARGIPDLTVSVGYALEDNQHVVQGSLSIPLPLFWRNQGKVGQNRALIHRAKLAIAQTKFRIKQQLARTLVRHKANVQMLTLLKRRIQALKARSALLTRGLREGGFSVFQVLTTQRSILKSQLLSIQSTQRTHESYIALCRAAGIQPQYGRKP